LDIFLNNTIVALSTAPGMGAIAIIRISGPKALKVVRRNVKTRSTIDVPNKLIRGEFYYGGDLLDQIMVCYFKSPNSYTGEDVIEIYCHGSIYIQQKILQCLVDDGLFMAQPGEFTLRAFLNKKMDLAQAEAVGDLIASESQASHRLAFNQLKGNYSETLSSIRKELIEFKSLIELELDFSQEDVQFADRHKLVSQLALVKKQIKMLIDSFAYGNVIKQGIGVIIVGRPNVGKSSLLNLLLNESKAIVSQIPGTTRDSIEDIFIYGGYKFRFIDTAGIRKTDNIIESMGIKIAIEKAQKAQFCIYLYDSLEVGSDEILNDINNVVRPQSHLLVVENKIDRFFTSDQKIESRRKTNQSELKQELKKLGSITYLETSNYIPSTIKKLTDKLVELVEEKKSDSSVVVTNIRHYQALKLALESLDQVKIGIEKNLSGDLLSIDLNQLIECIGQITGNIDIDQDILGNIFGNFCIGK